MGDSLKPSAEINPLAPAKAAFYSALVPGLGQVYNKKYWKVPLVYGAMGTSLYFYLDSQKKYNEVRDAYKRRISGYPNDDNFQFLDNTRLLSAQKFYQRNRDISLLITAAFYILNIVDANVDAHLKQFNVDDNLSLKPDFKFDEQNAKPRFGLSLNYSFK